MPDKIILYTNRRCPWAQRAHIALAELGVPFTEETIDLDTPRPEWYLKINPRGMVPALQWNDEVLIESAVVAGFLADQYPSHLVPASNAPGGALFRARVGLFVDAFLSKFQNHLFALVFDPQPDTEDKALDGLVKEVEPLLPEKGFFGGSDKLTLAEVMTGSFVVRLEPLVKGGVYPASLLEGIERRAPKFHRWAQAVAAHPSVNGAFDAFEVVEKTKERIAKMKK